jgi:hypothetical protein
VLPEPPYRCPHCGAEGQEPAPETALHAIAAGPPYRRPFADLTLTCPSCHAELKHTRRYLGILTAAQTKVLLTILVAGFTLFVLGILWVSLTSPWQR